MYRDLLNLIRRNEMQIKFHPIPLLFKFHLKNNSQFYFFSNLCYFFLFFFFLFFDFLFLFSFPILNSKCDPSTFDSSQSNLVIYIWLDLLERLSLFRVPCDRDFILWLALNKHVAPLQDNPETCY